METEWKRVSFEYFCVRFFSPLPWGCLTTRGHGFNSDHRRKTGFVARDLWLEKR
jgi:hypothetical protein